MKNRKYIIYVIAIIVVSGILLHFAGIASEAFTEVCDDHYYEYYKKDYKGYISPWYTDGLHVVDEGFIHSLQMLTHSKNDTGNIIAIGSSLTAMEFDAEKQKERLRDSYDMYVFASGSGSWRTNLVLDNLIRTEYEYTDKDIVKLEVSYSTFRNADNLTIAEATIDKWGKYRVEDDFSVKKNTWLLAPVYAMNVDLMRIQNVAEIVTSYFNKTEMDAGIGPANYRNNYFNHESVAESFAVTDERIDLIESQILRLDNDTNLVVEFSPMAPGLKKTKNGKEYNTCVKKVLKPFLKEHRIKYLDYRGNYKETEFIDGAHLSYDASIRYTLKLDHDLNKIIDEIDG
ncbi:MAG: hypothetical protein K5894_06000 [Lachnospiraceae bacterium]|nr:hypothetical protein [Lachnospiraceae bacterium]